MKTGTAIIVLTLLTSLMVTACGNTGCAPFPTAPTGASKTTSPQPDLSYEALLKGGFVDPSIPRITSEELKLRLDRGDVIILIDTRSTWKLKMGHLPGALNITYAVDSPYPGAEEAMDRELATLPDDVLKVLYCD